MKTSVKGKTWGFQEIKQQFLEGDNRVLLGAWVGAILLIFSIHSLLQTNRVSFLGVADSYELSINFEYPVEIKKIYIIPGQIVNKGELLAEFNQKEIEYRIRELESTIEKLEIEKSLRSDIQNLMVDEKGTSKDKDALAYEISSYKKELEFVKKQKMNLFVYAEDSGVVGAVNFKSGQQVPAFSTLMTILSDKPGMIKAYIHENIHSQAVVGQDVSLWSVANTEKKFSGTIVSIGSRIVEMPVRLTNSPNLMMWGREVVVRLNNDNTFLMGEKVVISTKSFWNFGSGNSAGATFSENTPESDVETSMDINKL